MQDKDNDRGSRDAAEHQQLRASVEADMERIRKGSAGAQDQDLAALKALAEAATPGPWDFDTAETPFRIAGGEVVGGGSLPFGDVYTVQEYETPEGSECLNIATEIGVDNGRFIAAANPAAILSLISRIEQQAARIAELEQKLEVATDLAKRFARSGDELCKKLDAAHPTPAVDLGGLTEKVRANMITAFNLGQAYWQQADSESVSQHKKAERTMEKFINLNDETCCLLSAPVVREGVMTEPVAEGAMCAPMVWPERDLSKPAEQQGVFRKFEVRRVDGSDQPGGKHHGCRYFVLDLDHDKHAPAAMRAYAADCADTHPALSAELVGCFGKSHTAPVAKMREMLGVQGQNGNWDYDHYMHGMYNGMEYMLAMVESRDPQFRSAPAKWLSDKLPTVTPSTPSQAWEGELPEPDVCSVLIHDDDGDKHEDCYTVETVRKAIGAAVAGVLAANRDAMREAVSEALASSNTYFCSRTWSAWQAGTMSEDDFQHPSTNGDLLDEITDAAIRSLRSNPVSQQPEPQGCESCIGTYNLLGEKCRKCGHVAESQGIKPAPHPVSQQDGEKGGA